jgi:hypothetical protein
MSKPRISGLGAVVEMYHHLRELQEAVPSAGSGATTSACYASRGD